MKKLFKRIALLLCIVTIFAIPSTVLASPIPIVTDSYDTEEFTSTIFEYLPGYFMPGGGNSLLMQNITSADGYWLVPAGSTFSTQINLEETGTFRILIVEKNTGTIVNQTVTGGWYHCELPVLTKDARYQVWLTPYSNVTVNLYMFFNFHNK